MTTRILMMFSLPPFNPSLPSLQPTIYHPSLHPSLHPPFHPSPTFVLSLPSPTLPSKQSVPPPLQIYKIDIDIPLIVNQGVSSFSDYPPRSMIYLDDPNPEPWTLHLAGLNEAVVFNVTPCMQVQK